MCSIKAIVTIGLPASGKTTFAKTLVQERFVLVERDDVRKSLAGKDFSWSTWDLQNEKKVTEIQYELLAQAAKARRSVVVSDTNLNKKTRDALTARLRQFGFDIEMVLFDVPCSVCEERNLKRSASEQVPFDVIPKLNNLFIKERQDLVKKAVRIITPEPCCGICEYFELDSSYFGFCVHKQNQRKEIIHTACKKACEKFVFARNLRI